MKVFRLGDTVRINAGYYEAFTGKVCGINQAKSLLKVAVTIFARTTFVVVKFADAEKVSAIEQHGRTNLN